MSISLSEIERVAGGPVAAIIIERAWGDDTVVLFVKDNGIKVSAGALSNRIECAAAAHQDMHACRAFLAMERVPLDAVLAAIQ